MAGWEPNYTLENACQSAAACRDYTGVRIGLIPEQYVGWGLIFLMVFFVILIVYGVLSGYFKPIENTPKKEPDKKGKRK